MKRYLLLAFPLVVTGCFESHDSSQRAIAGEDCYVCHQTTFSQPDVQQKHASFAAPGGAPPTTCQDCHDTTSWQPALGGLHPAPLTFTYTDPTSGMVKNDTFLLASSPHANIKCLACHDLTLQPTQDPPERGYNANCTQCHPNTTSLANAHQNVVRSFPGVMYTYTGYKTEDPTFCRTCHPQGLAMGHGPGNPFRLPHGRAACGECHDEASGRPDTGGANVRCAFSCHNGSGRGNQHCRDPGHKPNCLNAGCHPDGRKHDGEEHCPAATGT